MLANIGQEHPPEWIFRIRIAGFGMGNGASRQTHRAGNLISFRAVLLQKHHMSPSRCAKATGVIVRISRPGETVVWHLIPFFARDLASFATDADARIGEKTDFDMILHVGMFSLVRAMDPFADHSASYLIGHS